LFDWLIDYEEIWEKVGFESLIKLVPTPMI